MTFLSLMLLLFWHFSALQEAQEIFGGDFDFAEFDTEAYDHAEEEEEDQDDESWDRPKKQTKRRVGRRSIFEIYEPSELESSHMTDQDNEIRSTDMPERFQVEISVSLHIYLSFALCHPMWRISETSAGPVPVCFLSWVEMRIFHNLLSFAVEGHPCKACWGWWAGGRSWMDLQECLLHTHHLHAGVNRVFV